MESQEVWQRWVGIRIDWTRLLSAGRFEECTKYFSILKSFGISDVIHGWDGSKLLALGIAMDARVVEQYIQCQVQKRSIDVQPLILSSLGYVIPVFPECSNRIIFQFLFNKFYLNNLFMKYNWVKYKNKLIFYLIFK